MNLRSLIVPLTTPWSSIALFSIHNQCKHRYNQNKQFKTHTKKQTALAEVHRESGSIPDTCMREALEAAKSGKGGEHGRSNHGKPGLAICEDRRRDLGRGRSRSLAFHVSRRRHTARALRQQRLIDELLSLRQRTTRPLHLPVPNCNITSAFHPRSCTIALAAVAFLAQGV